jgi:hypothetical protein
MQKTSKRITSIKQYKLTDLLVFFIIIVAAELLAYYAASLYPSEAFYTFSFMTVITLLVMIRWGWQSIIMAVASALIYCILNGGTWAAYVTYIAGNSFIMLMLIPLKLIGWEKINKNWFYVVLFVICSWLCVCIGRVILCLICYAASGVNFSFVSVLVQFTANDLLSLAMSIAIILALRRFDGMVENQIHYLLRLDKERRQKMEQDTFGEKDIDLDEEALKVINKPTDLY